MIFRVFFFSQQVKAISKIFNSIVFVSFRFVSVSLENPQTPLSPIVDAAVKHIASLYKFGKNTPTLDEFIGTIEFIEMQVKTTLHSLAIVKDWANEMLKLQQKKFPQYQNTIVMNERK